jgi:hypothetical protein
VGFPEEMATLTAGRSLLPYDLALTDQSRGELGSATTLTGGTAQDKCVAAILDYALGLSIAKCAVHLGDALKSQNATTTEFPQTGECIFEAIDRSRCVQWLSTPDSVSLMEVPPYSNAWPMRRVRGSFARNSVEGLSSTA